MLYSDGKFCYKIEDYMHKHSEEWKKIFFDVLAIKVALLANKQEKIKLKEIDIEGMTLDVVKEAISVFDKFLINIKGYKKQPIIDTYDNSDCSLMQEIDYRILLAPFKDFFNEIEVR